MAHLQFANEATLRDGLFSSPENVTVIAEDVSEFVIGYATMLADKHVVQT